MTRNSIIKKRTLTQQSLLSLTQKALDLKNEYIKAKNDDPNEARIVDIDKVLKAIELIEKNLAKSSLSIEHATRPNVPNEVLHEQIGLYENSINQLKGAILELQQKIISEYRPYPAFFASVTNSTLYNLLLKIIDPASMGEDQQQINNATKVCIESCKSLFKAEAQQQAAEAIAEDESKSSTTDEKSDCDSAFSAPATPSM